MFQYLIPIQQGGDNSRWTVAIYGQEIPKILIGSTPALWKKYNFSTETCKVLLKLNRIVCPYFWADNDGNTFITLGV